jgi:hypothetical protein
MQEDIPAESADCSKQGWDAGALDNEGWNQEEDPDTNLAAPEMSNEAVVEEAPIAVIKYDIVVDKDAYNKNVIATC